MGTDTLAAAGLVAVSVPRRGGTMVEAVVVRAVAALAEATARADVVMEVVEARALEEKVGEVAEVADRRMAERRKALPGEVERVRAALAIEAVAAKALAETARAEGALLMMSW